MLRFETEKWRYLFIGGPLDGQVEEGELRPEIIIPLEPELPKTMMLEDPEALSLPAPLPRILYKRHKVRLPFKDPGRRGGLEFIVYAPHDMSTQEILRRFHLLAVRAPMDREYQEGS